MDSLTLTDPQFEIIKDWLYQHAGIFLNANKRSLVAGRLHKRLTQLELANYGQYIALLQDDYGTEREVAINLLTTNETYFFREPKHFEFIKHYVQALPKATEVKIWSAASSSGEEAYSIAMVLADYFGCHADWKVMGTDINTQVLQQAKKATYPVIRTEKIPENYLKKFCLKGVRKDSGWFKVKPEVTKHVEFINYNLMTSPKWDTKFDIIFLRNVLIYFNLAEKKHIIANVLRSLKPDGILIVGHSESIHGYHSKLSPVKPSCYRFKHD